jgi:hypothetical protein
VLIATLAAVIVYTQKTVDLAQKTAEMADATRDEEAIEGPRSHYPCLSGDSTLRHCFMRRYHIAYLASRDTWAKAMKLRR